MEERDIFGGERYPLLLAFFTDKNDIPISRLL